MKIVLRCLSDIAAKNVSNNQINDGIESSNNNATLKNIG
jgi:hypothetical protein